MKTNNIKSSSKSYLMAACIIFYGIFLVYGLFKFGNEEFVELKIPVFVYTCVIILMVISAISRYGKVQLTSFKLVLLGALIFMFSDSLIAINKFTPAFNSIQLIPRIMIMATYTVAQFLIVKGIIRQANGHKVYNYQ